MTFKIFNMKNLRNMLPQFLAVLCGTLNAISDGMQYGWTSPMIDRLEAPDSPVKITPGDVTGLEVIYMLTGLIGLPATIFLVDKIGRKRSVLLASASCLVGWILIAIADDVMYYYVARSIMGAAADMAFVSSPMYIAEIAHPKIRGFLSGIIYLMVFLGLLVIYAVGPFAPLYVPPIIGGTILLIQLSTFSFMPESPYFLLYKDKPVKARESLVRLRGTKDVDEELNDISAAIERQKSEKGRIKDLFCVKGNRKAIMIMTVLNGAQHMAGVTVISMNIHVILGAADSIYMKKEISAILFGALMLIATLCSVAVIDKFGRKIIVIVSATLTGLTLLAMAVYFHLKFLDVDVRGISWIPIASVMSFAVFFKAGLGIIPIVMTAELFSAKMKALGMGTADGIYILFSSFSIYLYQYLVQNVHIFLPFYLFSACCFFTAIFVRFFVPETKGKTLEEIQMILKN